MRDWRADIRERIAAVNLDAASEAEIVEELAQHLEDQFNELRRRGVPEIDATRTLRDQLNSPGFSEGLLRRRRAPHLASPPIGATNDTRGLAASVWQDLRYGVRSLRRSPAFTSVAILSLGLGIGANTAIFGLLNAVLLERLPVNHPEQLAVLQRTGSKGMFDRFAYDEYVGLKAATALPPIAALTGNAATVVARNTRDTPGTNLVSGGYFDLVGVRPILGRTISATDEAATAPVVVVSEDFWRQRLDADPSAIGQTISINEQPFTVIGVLPHSFRGLFFAGSFTMAVPLTVGPLLGLPSLRTSPNAVLSLVARLAPGVSRDQAGAAFDRTLQQCCALPAGDGPKRSIAPSPGRSTSAAPHVVLVDASRGVAAPKMDVRGQYRRILAVLMAGVGIVLLIACANVANLLLARAAARQRELAVRMSMGATRVRIIRQLFSESLELALAGAVIGLALAWAGTRMLAHNLPAMASSLADVIQVRPSSVILTFTAAISLGSTLLFGIYPAARATRTDIMTPLKDGGRNAGGRTRWSLDRGLVVAQVALALVLICASTLLVATLRNLRQFDGGYRTTHVLLVQIETRFTSYEARGMMPIYADLLDRIGRIPGIEAAAMSSTLPVYGGRSSRDKIRVPGYNPTPDEDLTAAFAAVTPGFFNATGIGLRTGRDFSRGDISGAEPVAIVSTAFARHYFPARDPIGASIIFGDDHPQQLRIVGVANDARYDDLRSPPSEIYYSPVAQSGNWPFLELAARTTGDPVSVAPLVTRELNAAAPGIHVIRPGGVEQFLDEALARERLAAALATLFGAFALGLAAVGLYGVVAYNVTRRTSEIGIRMALGARPVDALWLVVRQTLTMTAIGVGVGIPLALAAARAIGAQLYGIGSNDPRVMIAGALVLALASVLASAVPGRRAARIDPVEALRAE